MNWQFSESSLATMGKLNRGSLTKSFVPDTDIDWEESTTDEEYLALFQGWSLFYDSPYERYFDDPKRVDFAKYQQANLMMFSALAERYAIPLLSELLDLDDAPEFRDCVIFFIKEESYHYTMFLRAHDKILATMPERKQLPQKAMKRTLRWFFRFLNLIPWRRLRIQTLFLFFSFVEKVTIEAHLECKSALPRKTSFVRRIWELHAIDERRHLVFDELIMEKSRMPWGLRWLPFAMMFPWALLSSLCVNRNELWSARQLGVPVRLWNLRGLMKKAKAPFKLRLFALMRSLIGGRMTKNT